MDLQVQMSAFLIIPQERGIWDPHFFYTFSYHSTWPSTDNTQHLPAYLFHSAPWESSPASIILIIFLSLHHLSQYLARWRSKILLESLFQSVLKVPSMPKLNIIYVKCKWERLHRQLLSKSVILMRIQNVQRDRCLLGTINQKSKSWK